MTTWQEQAACRGAGVDLFFPRYGRPTRAALELCDTCPVRRDCRDHAKAHREPYGTWGGIQECDRPEASAVVTYAQKRRRQHRKRPAPPITTTAGLRRHLLEHHDIYTVAWTWAELTGRHHQEHQRGAQHAHEQAAG